MFDEIATYWWFVARAGDFLEGSWLQAALAAGLLVLCRVGAWLGLKTLSLSWWLTCGAFRLVVPAKLPPPPLSDAARLILLALESRHASWDEHRKCICSGVLSVWPQSGTAQIEGMVGDPIACLPENERQQLLDAINKAHEAVKHRLMIHRMTETIHRLRAVKKESAA